MSTIDDPVESASKHLHVEVDQQAKAVLSQPKVGKNLRPVYGQHRPDGFDLDNDRIVHWRQQ